MRIIAGEARGRKLKSVPGEGTSPTSDRLKETMFNILHFHLEGRRVLDLFAGTGQLGAEALSRGAKECVFIDQSNAAAAAIRENTQFFGARAVVRTAEAIRYLETTDGRFDIILLDPPYQGTLLAKSLECIFLRDLVNAGGFVLCECPKDTRVPEPPQLYTLQKEYKYGWKRLVLFSRVTEEQL